MPYDGKILSRAMAALMRTSSAGPSSSGSGSSVCFAGSRSWRISTAACAAP